MVFYPKALLATALFLSALVLAMNMRIGAATSILAVLAYVWIESLSMGLGPKGNRKP